jgi:hypothetical protein
MKVFKCDHCGKTEKPKEGDNYVENWDSVTISAHTHFDVCPDCAQILFEFFRAHAPSKGNHELPNRPIPTQEPRASV